MIDGGKGNEHPDAKRMEHLREPIQETHKESTQESQEKTNSPSDKIWQVTVPPELDRLLNKKRFPMDKPLWRRYFKTKTEMVCNLLWKFLSEAGRDQIEN